MENKFYMWWKDHRRVVTLGLFLSIFAFYLRTPFDKEAKVKDTCAKLNSSYQIIKNEKFNTPITSRYHYVYLR